VVAVAVVRVVKLKESRTVEPGCGASLLFAPHHDVLISGAGYSQVFPKHISDFPPPLMIVLTGATGGLGSQILKHILGLVPASSLRVSTQDPSKIPEQVRSSGVEIVRGDFGHPNTLDVAFAGADALLIVSYPSIAHEERVQMHTNAIDAAKRAGVNHIFYTSLAFDPAGGAAVMRAHRDSEQYLKESGLTYTIIREGIYSESYPLYFGAL
jgi:uncharacterized protein YbjT (DUF2867 family)